MATFSDEDDLDVAWEKILRRSNDLAGWQLDQQGPESVELVLARIKPSKNNTSQRQEVAQRVYKKSLVCVNRFGGIVAQGASMVFGPSQQCFNAVSFVIDAVQAYEEVFVNVTTLMERISAFLERLQMYLDQKESENKLDRRLRVTVYRVLDHFLTVLSIWHKLTHGGKTTKFKLGLKVAIFGEDDGVKDAMAKLEVLVKDVTRAEISAIVLTVSEAAKTLQIVDSKIDTIGDSQEKVAASIGRLESAEESKKRLEKIHDALNIDPSKRPWEETQSKLVGENVSGTGRWLLNFNPTDNAPNSFTRWADVKGRTVNVLSLVAGERFGKSHLCSIVINHLREKYRSDARVNVASYYLERDSSAKDRINAASKALIYQLASASTASGQEYAKKIKDVCEAHQHEFGKTTVLWDRLITKEAMAINATVFLVVDGVDEDDAKTDDQFAAIIRSIMSLDDKSPLKLRLFFTCRPHVYDLIKKQTGGIPQIQIRPDDNRPPLNQEDINLYTQAHLASMTIFNSEKEDVAKLRERAKLELVNGVNGDYYALNSKLEALTRSRTIDEVEDVLSRAKETRAQDIARDLEQLNGILREDEICELNELLMWEAASFEDLSISQYESILKLSADTKILLPLKDQVRDRYFRLFKVDDDDQSVTLKSQDIKEHLRRATAAVHRESPVSSSTCVKLQEGEITVVSRILRTYLRTTFGDDDVYNKFGFDAFFKAKMGSEAIRIRLEEDAAIHVQVARGCLHAVCEHHEDEAFTALRSYAWEYFADHLTEKRNLYQEDWIADVDLALKQDIGRKLVRILRDVTLIDAWFREDLKYIRRIGPWVYTATYTTAVSKWLRDADVRKGLRDMPSDLKWVIDNTAKDVPVVAILQDIAKEMARNWFEQKTDELTTTYMFIHGYMSLMQGENLSQYQCYDWLTVQQIRSIEDWAKRELGNGDEETKWHSCLAKTLRIEDHLQEAIIHYERFLALEPGHWQMRLEYAKLLRRSKDTQKSIRELHALMRDNQQHLTHGDMGMSDGADSFEKARWDIILPELESCYHDLEDFSNAEQTHRQILEEAQKRNEFTGWAIDSVLKMIKAYHKQAKFENILATLREMAARPIAVSGSWLITLLETQATDAVLHVSIRTAAARAERSGDFVESYHAAISSSAPQAGKKNCSIMLHLKYHLACLMWSQASDESRKFGLQLLEEAVLHQADEDVEEDYQVGTAQRLAAQRFATAIVSAVRAEGHTANMKAKASLYTARLEALTAKKGDEYPFLTMSLARLKHISGDTRSAKDVGRDGMRKALDDAAKIIDKDGDSGSWVFVMWDVSYYLQAVDDDLNALAAWQSRAPLAPKVESEHSDGLSAKAPKPVSAQEGQEALGTARDILACHEDDQRAQAGADRTDDEPDRVPSEECPAFLEASDDNQLDASLQEWIKSRECSDGTCDGCGSAWSSDRALWACKDCDDVQFCPQCIVKLRAGVLYADVCDKEHSHLHVPLLTEEQWRQGPKDSILVAGEYVPRAVWLENIRKIWGVDQRTLAAFVREATAALKIQKAWKQLVESRRQRREV